MAFILCLVGGFCPQETLNTSRYGTYNWNRTGGNNTAMLPCDFGRVQDGQPGGVAVRRCQAGGSWNTPDFSQCRDSESDFILLYHKVGNFDHVKIWQLRAQNEVFFYLA